MAKTRRAAGRAAQGRNRRRSRKDWKYENFKHVLALPERLALYLRLLLHLRKADWDFGLDKLRQHIAWEAKPEGKRPAVKITVKGKVRTSRTGLAYLGWSKSKGRGKGRRYFAAPCDELALVQRAVLNRFLSQVPVHFARYGGQVGSSIMANADHHAGFAKTVFCLDIANAYPTVYRSRVRATLKKPFGFALRQFGGVEFADDDVAMMLDSLVDLIVFNDRLPQGPPTSPRMFDIACGKMDREIFQALQENATAFQGYRYSAWTDNLTISSDGDIPGEIREAVIGIVRSNGFYPHTRPDKMLYFSPGTGERPIVTGLVLNDDGRITMAPRKANQLRSRLNHLLRRKVWDSETAGLVAGTLGYIRQVYPARLPSALRELVGKAETRLSSLKSGVDVGSDSAVGEEHPQTEDAGAARRKTPPDGDVSEAVM